MYPYSRVWVYIPTSLSVGKIYSVSPLLSYLLILVYLFGQLASGVIILLPEAMT